MKTTMLYVPLAVFVVALVLILALSWHAGPHVTILPHAGCHIEATRDGNATTYREVCP